MRRVLFLALAITALCARPVLAATADMSVTATFRTPTSVAINAASDMLFGVYNPLAPVNLDTSSTINITSSPAGRTYEIFASLGNNPAGAQRRMSRISPPASINYDLFWDSIRTVPVLSSAGMAGARVLNTTGGAADVTLYGRIVPSQSAPDGDYADMVTVFVFYTP